MLVDQINSLLSTWKASYSQQPQAIKILIPALLFFLVCCLCSVPVALSRRGSPATAQPSPDIFPTSGTQVTPTGLFDFDFPTFTPFPTLPLPSPFPTQTPLPTGTQTATSLAPTSTVTPLPTLTSSQVPPTATRVLPTATRVPPTATRVPSVAIVRVNKVAEFTDLQNVSPAAINLDGWRLVSEAGDQSCELEGTLAPGEDVRIWANRGPGFDCRLSNDVWLDNEPDPAVLYNAQNEEVARFP